MKCTFIKPDKLQCQANAMTESSFCYLHNPDITQKEKLQAQVRGGQARSLKITNPLPPIKIEKTSDIMSLLTDTINQVRQGDLDCRIGNTVGYLAGIAIKAYEISELEERVAKIESHVIQSKP